MAEIMSNHNMIANAIIFILLIIVGFTSYYVYDNIETVRMMENAGEYCRSLGFIKITNGG